MPKLLVDFDDYDSVAQGITQAETLMREAEGRQEIARDEASKAHARAGAEELEIRRLRGILLMLEQLNGSDPPPAPPASEEGSRDLALRVVITINGPTNIGEVAEHMDGFSRKTVSWALWKLADEGAIQRLSHGQYAPLRYVPGQPTTNYFYLPPGTSLPSHVIAEAVEYANAVAAGRLHD